MTQLSPQRFQQLVLKWFDAFGRKNFPWQHNKTPYSVWVSEIMLQQTQVSTVIPYYQRFLQEFPDVASLARAPEDKVLHLWTGLGYYSRARNLHRAAQMVMEEFQGELPSDLEDLQKLPGIGRSTAGAIISCAFHKKASILDGNVKRLLSRFHGLTEPIDDKQTLDQLWKLSEEYTPSKRIADYTQVMMDLGATLCSRSKPRCEDCPLVKSCQAYRLGLVNEIPAKKKKAALAVRQATFLVLKHKDKVLLQKRSAKGIWGGLWSLPEIPEQATPAQIKRFCLQEFKLQALSVRALKSFRHSFSHYHLEIIPMLVEIKAPGFKVMEASSQIWYSLRRPEVIGLPAPVLSLLGNLA